MRQHDSNIGRLHAIGAAIFMLVVSAGAARAQVSLVGAGLAGTPDVPVNPCEGSDDPNDCIVPCVVRPNPYDTRGVTNTNIWPGGIVPYTFGDDATQQQRDFARAGMDVIESVANITFIPRTNEANYVRLIPDSGNWSYVGRIGGRQDLGLYNWSNQGIVIHELMHALGIHHEQSHAQRDTYVFINYPKIQPGRENNFALRASTPTVGPYDFESLMHYGPTGFSINGDRTIKVRPAHARAYQYVIGQRGAPSNGDIWTLVTMYGGNPPARNFTLSTPANSVAVGENWAPTFTWATSQNATSYNIKVDDDPFFGSPEINANTAGTVYSQATVLAPRRVYYWTVTSSNSVGNGKPFHETTFAFYTGASVPAVVYVDATAPAGGDGTSWSGAFRDLQDAMAIAGAFPGQVQEVRVAHGTYRPDRGTRNRSASFWLVEGTTVRGGYAGRGAPNPDLNNPSQFLTILSGDLNSNDSGTYNNMGDNSFNVVTGSFTGPGAVLENVTIRGGNASDGTFPRSRGGALQVDMGSPTLRNVVIERSQSSYLFGGVSLSFGGDTVFENVTMRNLRATGTGSNGAGGMIGARHDSRAFLRGAHLFSGSGRIGGALYAFDTQVTLDNTIIRNTVATEANGGGGIYLTSASATVTNSTLAQNTSGAIRLDPTASLTMNNSIIWGNTTAGIIADSGSTATVGYSTVQGGFAGAGNLSGDPLFVDVASGDLSLLSGSPAIDSGNNAAAISAGLTADIAGMPRFADDPLTPDTGAGGAPIVDQGAYEYQPPVPCVGDFNNDGAVDGADVGAFFAAWEAAEPAADLNEDGGIDGADVEFFFLRWEDGC
ncbi:MAG: right-handed parallel beta-helix repeat-containing protein [Phycisphaeraceae bacterium]|nr:right-handed parallel beta-helix repeat-containing protein [Phycisphaeraceae bacterium]